MPLEPLPSAFSAALVTITDVIDGGWSGTQVIGELHTNLGERFAIFDQTVLADAHAYQQSGVRVQILTHRSLSYPVTEYVTQIRAFNPHGPTHPCLRCDAVAALKDERTDGVAFYECPSCHYLMFVSPIPKHDDRPTKARARLSHTLNALFFLDHQEQTATLVDVFGKHWTTSAPYLGVHSEIEPFAETFTPARLGNKTLRLMGYPFNGSVVYRICVPPLSVFGTAPETLVPVPAATERTE